VRAIQEEELNTLIVRLEAELNCVLKNPHPNGWANLPHIEIVRYDEESRTLYIALRLGTDLPVGVRGEKVAKDLASALAESGWEVEYRPKYDFPMSKPYINDWYSVECLVVGGTDDGNIQSRPGYPQLPPAMG